MGTLQWSSGAVGPGKRSYRRAENVVKRSKGRYTATAKCSLPMTSELAHVLVGLKSGDPRVVIGSGGRGSERVSQAT
jgi:hypothetical protein